MSSTRYKTNHDACSANKFSNGKACAYASDNFTMPRINSSSHAANTCQPLNELTDNMKPSCSDKSLIKLSIGDPTVDGNLRVPEVVENELVNVVRSVEFNGYPPTAGYDNTRQAVEQYTRKFCTTKERQSLLNWENVIITSGVSHAIVLAIVALCNPGDNILVGQASFPHYKSVCDSYGIECRYYPLQSKKHWEADLEIARSLVDERTRCFVIINPSNPCGSNFSRSHVNDIIRFCEYYKLPLIADEIYAELVYNGAVFTSIADFDTHLPRLILNGTAKFHACPGWRVGWIFLIDDRHYASDWFKGMINLAQLISGVNSLCQETVARTLSMDQKSHTEHFISQLEQGAKVYTKLLEYDLGLTFDKPCASMFVMIQIDYTYYADIHCDMEFYEKLLDEENVQVLPGNIFGTTGFVRATVSRPVHVLREAVDRIISFCQRHKK